MGVPVNKAELISAVAEKSGQTKADSERGVNAVLDVIKSALKDGEDIRLVDFGTFSVTNRAATTGRNPRTGEPIQIAASKSAKFKPGKALKDAVNGRS